MIKKSLAFTVALGLLAIVYLTLRISGYDKKMTFHLDQGLHLLESYEMVQNRDIRLIGPKFISKTYMDRNFFGGPQYYYALAISGEIWGWNPLKMSLFFTLIEFGIIIYFIYWIKNKYGTTESLLIFALITVSKYLIIHSRFIWNPHFLLPLGMLAIIVLDNYISKSKLKYLALFSFIWGTAFGFHFAAALWAIPLIIILWKNKKLFTSAIFLVPIFFILGDLPYFIFELRHNFYNIRTLMLALFVGKDGSNMEPHYLINPFLPYLLVLMAIILNKIKPAKIKISIGLTVIILLSLIQLKLFQDSIPYGHPNGWNYPLEEAVVDKILENGCPKNFNVASTVSGDTRSYDLRFLLTAKNCPPMGVEDYPSAEKLFLVAPPSRTPEKEGVWEVSSLGKFEIKDKIIYNPNVIYYKLEK